MVAHPNQHLINPNQPNNKTGKMKKREAIQILIQAGVNDYVGSGKGFRSTNDDWRKKVREAIKVMWKHLNKREITETELFNLGIL